MLAGSHLFAVADGMGGHAAGDVASAIVVRHLADLASRPNLDRTTVLDQIRQADNEVSSHDAGASTGMGTTVAGIAFLGSGSRRLLVFNIGDSRVYRLRAGQLIQLTHDHSVVQELLDSGTIDAAESHTHPERHVITRSLGTGMPIDIDWWHMEPRPGDRYLVTSDGLTKEIDPDQIAVMLARGEDPNVTAAELVAAALDAGGHDNITVVVVDAVADPAEIAGIDPLDIDTSERKDRRTEADVDVDTTPSPLLTLEPHDPEVVANVGPDPWA